VGIFGQSAKKSLNYQAVILDPKAIDIPGASIVGQPLSKGKVCLKFSLVNAQGSVDYEETQQTTTDEYGLVSLSIGTGAYSSGTYKNFESIVWDANVKSMKVAVSFDACNTFKQVSTQALNYTPYSLYAEAVEYKNVREAPTKLSQFSNDVGFLVPKDLDPLKADIKKNTDDIKINTADIKTNTADIKTNTADIKSNATQIASANKAIVDNKKASDDAFLIVNQSISTLVAKVALNSDAIWVVEGKVADLQYQTSEIRKQIANTETNFNNQINGLQKKINSTDSTVSKIITNSELISNKSTATNLGGANPSDQLYASQKAVKTYVDQATQGVAFQVTVDTKADINSPVFTGTPSLPTGTIAVTQNSTDNSSKIATTGFVQQVAIDNQNLLIPFVNAKAPINSPVFTGTPNLPTGTISVTQSIADSSSKVATTAFVRQIAAAGQAYVKPFTDDKAPINSPVFTGTPSLPTGTIAVTQNSKDNSTKIATTGFVQQVAIDNQNLLIPIVNAKAPINSPVFTGTPSLPTGTMAVTQDDKDNSTKIATTEFVQLAYNKGKAYIDANLLYEISDEFTATASQISFTLNTYVSDKSIVKMYINGIRVSNACYSWKDYTVTYDPSKNGGYDLTAGDRIQFDYFYVSNPGY